MQRDKELEAKWQKVESKKVEFEKKLQEEIVSLEDVGYTMFDEGFDKTIA